MILAAGADTRALWYLTRGTGLVSLVLLTMVVLLGVLTTVRWTRPSWPRFATMDLHRNLSLLVVAFVAIHVVTAVTDPFAPLRVLDVVVPFGSRYRPLWVGFGAIAFDLLAALVVTSLLRLRLGHRRWRAVHWLAYLSWPVAVLHGLGTGSDTRVGWTEALTWACVAAVVAAVWWRIGHRWPQRVAVRSVAALASIAVPVGLAAFTVSGPLQPGWARKAGTPASILGPATAPAGTSTASVAAGRVQLPYSGTFAGSVRQSDRSDGTSVIRLSGPVAGTPGWQLDIALYGQPLANGGVAMTSSAVTMSAAGVDYRGQVTGLQGDLLVARLAAAGQPTALLQLRLALSGSTASGSLTLSADRRGNG